MASTDIDHLARTAYEAHRKAHPDSLPEWEDVPAPEKQAWRAAVSAVTNQGEATLADTGRTQSIALQVGDQARVFQTEFTAGRKGSLVINDNHASSHHALFQPAHGYWFVEDLGSTNGTYIGSVRITQPTTLTLGTQVRVGKTVLELRK